MALNNVSLKEGIGFCLQVGGPAALCIAALCSAINMGVAKGPLADIPLIQESAKFIAHYAMLSPLITLVACAGLFLLGQQMRAEGHSWPVPKPFA